MKRSANTTILSLAVLALSALAIPAYAQTETQLQNDNERLRQQNDDLARQLEAANARIAALEAQVQQLQEALRKAGQTPPSGPQADVVSVDETKPDASPRGLFNALHADYLESFTDVPMGERGSRERTAYLRNVDRWVGSANRKYKVRVQWHVKLHERPSDRIPDSLKLVAVDPVSSVPLGEPFLVRLNRGLIGRLESLRLNYDDIFVLRGVVTPHLTVNDRAEVSGAFDRPKVVGPFAEFNYTVDPQAFLTVKEMQEEAATPTGG